MFGLAGRKDDPAPALLEPSSGTILSHAQLYARVMARTETMPCGKGLVLLGFAPDIDSVVTYLAALEAGHAVMPLPPDLAPDKLARLMELYRPEIVAFPHCHDQFPGGLALHPDLALVLSTSGSTGSPKMVRLSSSAVEANARQIVQALGITAGERAPTTLPPSYSYGLSVLNSHLMAGASVILTAEGLMSRQLWQDMARHEATSFAGVPASYDMLRRLDLESVFPPSLKTLTQAGGAMAPAMVTRMRDFITGRGGRLFVMYGQTEACARMAVLPPHDLPRCLGAAGLALPEGRFWVEEGRIHYSGPNVMMGYGQCRADLALGDQMGGQLDTGDLGRLDPDGMLWITGRVKRLAKLGGLRINLDEVETLAAAFGPAAVSDGGEVLVVTLAGDLPDTGQRRDFAQGFGLHSSQIRWRAVEALPLTANGKIDYGALT